MWPADERLQMIEVLGGLHVGGRYRIEERLGRGAGGVVFRALDEHTGRAVCIKALNPTLDGDLDSRCRFDREYEALFALEHPGVCRVFDRGEEGGAAWLAMELIEGETLVEHLRRGPLAPELTLRVARHAASALAAAHEHGIVHRDVKPANIMIERSGRVVLLDFGIALRAGDERLTRPGFLLGSSHYVAPELWRGEEPSAASDVWALGVVLYACLTARRPFSAKGPEQLVEQIMTARPARPRLMNNEAHPVVERLVFAALQSDVTRRPRDGAALLDLLDRTRQPSTCDELTEAVPTSRREHSEVTPLPPRMDAPTDPVALVPAPISALERLATAPSLRLVTIDDEVTRLAPPPSFDVLTGEQVFPAGPTEVVQRRGAKTRASARPSRRPGLWALVGAACVVGVAVGVPWVSLVAFTDTAPSDASARVERPAVQAKSPLSAQRPVATTTAESFDSRPEPVTVEPAIGSNVPGAAPADVEGQAELQVERRVEARAEQQIERTVRPKQVQRARKRTARRRPRARSRSALAKARADRAENEQRTSLAVEEPSPAVSAAELKDKLATLRRRVAARGLRGGDVRSVDKSLAAATTAARSGDVNAYELAAARVDRAAAEVAIDAAFVRAKLLRFNRAFDRRGTGDADDVMRHALAVNTALSRGKPTQANAALNRAFAALR